MRELQKTLLDTTAESRQTQGQLEEQLKQLEQIRSSIKSKSWQIRSCIKSKSWQIRSCIKSKSWQIRSSIKSKSWQIRSSIKSKSWGVRDGLGEGSEILRVIYDMVYASGHNVTFAVST